MCRLREYAHSIWSQCFFGTFAQKMGQKGLKMGLKCPGLVWYGLAWMGYDPGTWLNPKQHSKFSKIAELKV